MKYGSIHGFRFRNNQMQMYITIMVLMYITTVVVNSMSNKIVFIIIAAMYVLFTPIKNIDF